MLRIRPRAYGERAEFMHAPAPKPARQAADRHPGPSSRRQAILWRAWAKGSCLSDRGVTMRQPWRLVALLISTRAFSGPPRSFLFSPKLSGKPKLILISGSTGTGKSTFGMSVALDQGILKCVSTDTVRAVLRKTVSAEASPALHRSSYQGGGDAVAAWREAAAVVDTSVDALVTDAINRGVSLVVEGVHVVPSDHLLARWRASGGRAIGCLLTIRDEDAHRALILRRGEITRQGEEKKIQAFGRIRAIQDEMMRLGEEAGWLLIEQRIEPDPLEMVYSMLEKECEEDEEEICEMPGPAASSTNEGDCDDGEDCRINVL